MGRLAGGVVAVMSPIERVLEPDFIVLAIHAVSTWYMVGLIWFVQVVHYPLKATMKEPEFSEYQRQHMQRTSWVVGPPMLLEAAMTAWLVLNPPAPDLASYTLLGVALLVIVWGSTAVFLVPLHNRLVQGFDSEAVRALCRANWIRTFAWTMRGGVALILLVGGIA